MPSRVEYRRHAEKCFRMAEHSESPEGKLVLIVMANVWHRLAQDLENRERVSIAAALRVITNDSSCCQRGQGLCGLWHSSVRFSSDS
jgi:hypothetical protein